MKRNKHKINKELVQIGGSPEKDLKALNPNNPMIKLFEEFEQRGGFEESLDPKKGTKTWIYSPPGNLRGASVIGGHIKWDIEVIYKKWGIDIGAFSIYELELTLEVEDEEKDESFEKTILVKAPQLSNPDHIRTYIEGFPLGIEDIEIEMRNTEDPEFWKYEIRLGKEEE